METILFDSYRKYLKNKEKNIIKTFFALPIVVKILLIAILIFSVLSILFAAIEYFRKIYLFWIFVVGEVAVCIVLYFYTENYKIKNSDETLLSYKDYCKDIKSWLDDLGFISTPKNITVIINRAQKRIEFLETKREKNRERIEKWIQFLIIPILLAVFSAIISKQTDLDILIKYTVYMIMSVVVLTLCFFSYYNLLQFFKKREIEQMKNFVEDLQGVIDYHSEDKLIKITKQKKKNKA